MLLSDIRRVAILCPVGMTGGPEALHQLSYVLNAIGVRSSMVYVGPENAVELQTHRIVCRRPQAPRPMAYYGEYDPQVSAEIPLDAQTLVVLPEAYAARHGGFPNARVAIWWLSVDNAFSAQLPLGEPAVREAIARAPHVTHLYQSVYAREFLRDAGAVQLHALGDHTSALFARQTIEAPPPEPFCTYNGAKGAELAQTFFAGQPDLQAIALKGFSKPQLRDLFRSRLLYVDFGHQPGRDRMPREAAASGGLIFVRRHGAGAHYDDFAIPDFFKFDLDDVTSGSLAERLAQVVAAPATYWSQQAAFRMSIAWEKATFTQQVMRLFGQREPV